MSEPTRTVQMTKDYHVAMAREFDSLAAAAVRATIRAGRNPENSRTVKSMREAAAAERRNADAE